MMNYFTNDIDPILLKSAAQTGRAISSTPPSSALNLPTLFNRLAPELQSHILSYLTSSPAHLLSLSLCSHHLHSLVLPHLFSNLHFSSRCKDEKIESFLKHATAQRHGRLVRELKLEGSLGPLICKEVDRKRAERFASILRERVGDDEPVEGEGKEQQEEEEEASERRGRLREITINLAGSDLTVMQELLFAIVDSRRLSSLRRLNLQLFDIEEHEAPVLVRFWEMFAKNASTNLPSLEAISLEGYWQLASSSASYTATVLENMSEALAALPRLRTLRLAYFDMSPRDLGKLLKRVKGLEILKLHEMPGLVRLQDNLTALGDTELANTLKELNIVMNGFVMLGKTAEPDPPRCQSESPSYFQSLHSLSLGISPYFDARQGGENLARTLLNSFSALPTNRFAFPHLSKITIFDAFDHSHTLSIEIARQLVHAKQAGLVPRLTSIEVDSLVPRKVLEAPKGILDKAGIQLMSPVVDKSKVLKVSSEKSFAETDGNVEQLGLDGQPTPKTPRTQATRTPGTPGYGQRV